MNDIQLKNVFDGYNISPSYKLALPQANETQQVLCQ
jgi:hypothetical protein